MGEFLLNMLLFQRNRLLFSRNVFGGQGFDRAVKFVTEDDIPPVFLHCGKPVNALKKDF